MKNRARYPVILLLGAAWLACTDASAQAHGPPATEFLDEPESDAPEARAARTEEAGAFLRRLVGRFRDTKGVSNSSERLVDCEGIGAGPGVQCMVGLGSRNNTGGGVSAFLFGLDPGSGKVNFLRVNAKGEAEGGLGKFSGNTLFLNFKCLIPPDAQNIISCEDRLRFYTTDGSNEVSMASEYIMRIRTPKGIEERSFVSNNWLNRAMAVDKKKGGTAGKQQSVPPGTINSR